MKQKLFLLFILLLCSCQNQKPPMTIFSGNAMVMNYRLTIGQPLKNKEKRKIEQILQDTFVEINEIYNRYNPDSELSKLNQLPANTKVTLSPQLAQFLQWTGEFVKMTGGRFDPTVDPLAKLWKQHLELGTLPPQSLLDETSEAIGWHNIHLEGSTFWKDHDLTSLDLGGIAKGLCVDLVIERLKQAGLRDIFFEWGGEIRATGQHPEGRPWYIFISRLGDPNPEHSVAHIALQNQAIATSGDYQQFWTLETQNVTYTHIINPHTLHPLKIEPDKVASTSVLAPTCALADAIATTLMLFENAQEAQAWAENLQRSHPELSFWLMERKREAQ